MVVLDEEDEAKEEDVEEVLETNHMQEDEEEFTMTGYGDFLSCSKES